MTLALTLDPNNATAHADLSSIHDVYDWDRDAAERQSKLALALAPRDPHVLFLAGQHSMVMDRLDEALAQLNASLAQDPLNPATYVVLSLVQLRRNRLAEAEIALRRVLELAPTFAGAHYFLGTVLLVGKTNSKAALAWKC